MPGDETRPTAYEPGAQRRRPSLERWDIPYEERLRGQRRERERNVQHIVQAERHWEIARLTLSRMAGENELLRGVHIAEQNRVLWWPARIMSHGAFSDMALVALTHQEGDALEGTVREMKAL